MKYLLDTHTFIWMISFPEYLSDIAREIILSSNNLLFLSAVSGLEIVIKYQIGKLELPEEPIKYVSSQMKKNYIDELAITMSHTLNVKNLPDIHKESI